MRSSNRFGGRTATAARPRVQIRPAGGAEAGTVVPAQHEIGVCGERQLLAHDLGDVHAGGTVGQRIEIGIVGGVRVGGEHRGVDVDIHIVQHIREAPAALAAHDSVHVAPPKVLAVPGGLELSRHVNRLGESEPQPLERRIVGWEPPFGPDGTPLKVPNVNSQHSPLR